MILLQSCPVLHWSPHGQRHALSAAQQLELHTCGHPSCFPSHQACLWQSCTPWILKLLCAGIHTSRTASQVNQREPPTWLRPLHRCIAQLQELLHTAGVALQLPPCRR
ncbi:hypothetical protein DIPPA_56610 [Diplonema papillatum]|nr:hypothetical protein DIPPA_56699 [Diplonema papillatum]KAJ9437335.1 hypothetical protein DIPPA_56699 [Diplonema papillatum]KAJ9437926.1 hypothetical protein DIPPA_56610 [Diplonema papillatum]KAJ9437927.1 hypothetical protein DIPPA_56610 [Diplonema papillatum]